MTLEFLHLLFHLSKSFCFTNYFLWPYKSMPLRMVAAWSVTIAWRINFWAGFLWRNRKYRLEEKRIGAQMQLSLRWQFAFIEKKVKCSCTEDKLWLLHNFIHWWWFLKSINYSCVKCYYYTLLNILFLIWESQSIMKKKSIFVVKVKVINWTVIKQLNKIHISWVEW